MGRPLMRLRELLVGGAGGASMSADAGLLLLRVFAGAALALGHGIDKLPPSPRFVAVVDELGFRPPELFAMLAGLAEFAGGLLLVLGLLTRPAALFVLISMLVALVLRHAGDPFAERELALLYAVIAAVLLLTGAGRYAFDARLRRRGAGTRTGAVAGPSAGV